MASSRRVGNPSTRFRTAVAVTFQEVEVPMTAVVSRPAGTQVNFHIGDKVQVGTRVGTITDVGNLLIQVRTTEGSRRVVFPWELVRTRDT